MIIKGNKIVGWQDFMELSVASWVCLSPFLLGFFMNENAALSALVIGSVMIMFAVLGLATHRMGDEYGTIAAALFLLASPWAFSYTEVGVATMNATVCAMVMLVLGFLAIREEKAELETERETRPSH